MENEMQLLKCVIRNIAFSHLKLDAAYSNEEAFVEEASWELFINWKIDTAKYPQQDVVKVINRLNLYRKEDQHHIARLHCTTTFHLSKNLSFAEKYSVILIASNISAGHLQAGWRVQVGNESVASLVPPCYNSVLSMETDIKQMIYEDWI